MPLRFPKAWVRVGSVIARLGCEGVERARPVKIGVLFCPRIDHFSSSFKGSGLYAQETANSDA